MTPITAPSIQMQTELLQSVYEDNNVNPNLVQYIEAHGKFTWWWLLVWCVTPLSTICQLYRGVQFW
jgi:hypothetical protein